MEMVVNLALEIDSAYSGTLEARLQGLPQHPHRRHDVPSLRRGPRPSPRLSVFPLCNDELEHRQSEGEKKMCLYFDFDCLCCSTAKKKPPVSCRCG